MTQVVDSLEPGHRTGGAGRMSQELRPQSVFFASFQLLKGLPDWRRSVSGACPVALVSLQGAAPRWGVGAGGQTCSGHVAPLPRTSVTLRDRRFNRGPSGGTQGTKELKRGPPSALKPHTLPDTVRPSADAIRSAWCAHQFTHTYVYVHTCTKHIHACMRMCLYTYTHMCLHPCTHIHPDIDTCLYTHTRKPHTHVHTHAHVYIRRPT